MSMAAWQRPFRYDQFSALVGYRDVRQKLIQRFPYVVAFLVEQETVSVVAVFHGSRDPGAWRMRLK